MDFIFELLFEVILEGSYYLVTNKKVALWIRILVSIPLIIVYGGLFLLFLMLMFDCLKEHDYLFAFIMFIVNIIYVGMIVYFLIKKRKEVLHEKDEFEG